MQHIYRKIIVKTKTNKNIEKLKEEKVLLTFLDDPKIFRLTTNTNYLKKKKWKTFNNKKKHNATNKFILAIVVRQTQQLYNIPNIQCIHILYT